MGKLRDALIHHADRSGRRVAMSDSRCTLTQAELAQWVAGAATDLATAPETVGIFGGNGIEWAVALRKSASTELDARWPGLRGAADGLDERPLPSSVES